MTVPHFQAVALCVAASDMLGNLPIHFARRAARLLDLDLYLPPFDPPILGGSIFWHRRFDRDPANVWLRGQIAEALDLGRVDADRLRVATMVEAVEENAFPSIASSSVSRYMPD